MRNSMIPKDTVACRFCGSPTDRLATRMCHTCWELEIIIRTNKDIVAKILNTLNNAP